MLQAIIVLKFNNAYFEQGDEVAIKTKSGETIKGSIITKNQPCNSCTSLQLDISEKYHKKTTEIDITQIIAIDRI